MQKQKVSDDSSYGEEEKKKKSSTDEWTEEDVNKLLNFLSDLVEESQAEQPKKQEKSECGCW